MTLLISKNIKKSFYANQEIGVAIGRNKTIIPISIDGTKPYGLIDHLHAEECNQSFNKITTDEEIIRVVTRIFTIPIKHKQFKKLKYKAINSLIYALINSDSFTTTSFVLTTLIEVHNYMRFDQKQVREIIKAIKKNPNIYKTDFLLLKLIDFLQSNYKITIDLLK